METKIGPGDIETFDDGSVSVRQLGARWVYTVEDATELGETFIAKAKEARIKRVAKLRRDHESAALKASGIREAIERDEAAIKFNQA